MTMVPEKDIFRSVTVYNKIVSSKCNLPAEIKQEQDKKQYHTSISLLVLKYIW